MMTRPAPWRADFNLAVSMSTPSPTAIWVGGLLLLLIVVGGLIGALWKHRHPNDCDHEQNPCPICTAERRRTRRGL